MTAATAGTLSVNADDLVAFAQDAMARARRVSSERLTGFSVDVAGMHVRVGVSDAGLATLYRDRLGRGPIDDGRNEPDVRLLALRAADLGLAPPVLSTTGKDTGWFQAEMRRAGLRGPVPHDLRVWRLFDPDARFGLQLLGDTADLPPWDAGSPLLHLIRYALGERDLRVCHAATVADRGRGIVIFGDGGAGKSATTLTGICAGLSTVGDDYIAVRAGEPFVARPLYRVIKQAPAFLRRLGDRAATAAERGRVNWQGKIELDPCDLRADCLIEEMSIDAVAVPRIEPARRRPDAVPISPAVALRAAMRTNLYQHHAEPDDGLAFFSRLTRVPCFRLDLGTDLTANADLLTSLVRGDHP